MSFSTPDATVKRGNGPLSDNEGEEGYWLSERDAQTAFKSAMVSSTPDADVLRNIHISDESLRKSTDLRVKHIALWVSKVVRFAPALSESAQRDWHLLWTDLGVQLDVADFPSCTLWLCWEEGGHLGRC